MIGDAVISADGAYRYVLSRRWGDGPVLPWIMLNPSTADADTDDPTITRCVRRALRWKLRGVPYGGICVLNLFALRATDPAALRGHPDPAGPDNDRWLRGLTTGAQGPLVVAWGDHAARPWARSRCAEVLLILRGLPLHCLGITASGQPRHPGRLGYDALLVPWKRP